MSKLLQCSERWVFTLEHYRPCFAHVASKSPDRWSVNPHCKLHCYEGNRNYFFISFILFSAMLIWPGAEYDLSWKKFPADFHQNPQQVAKTLCEGFCDDTRNALSLMLIFGCESTSSVRGRGNAAAHQLHSEDVVLAILQDLTRTESSLAKIYRFLFGKSPLL